jgi:hypothetical protein
MIEQDYEVRVSYEGGIMLGATSAEEALTKAKEIMLEETNPDMAKYLEYKIEVFPQDDTSPTINDLIKIEEESNA